MRRLVLVACALGMWASPLVGSAVAKPPVGGCPSAEWFLAPSPDDISGSPSADQNGDGFSCFLEAPEGGGIFTIVDNASHPR
jgi:hypothetical protein